MLYTGVFETSDSQNVVLAEIGVNELTSLVHEPQSDHKFRIQLWQLSGRNIGILESWRCPEGTANNQPHPREHIANYLLCYFIPLPAQEFHDQNILPTLYDLRTSHTTIIQPPQISQLLLRPNSDHLSRVCYFSVSISETVRSGNVLASRFE